MSDFIPEIDEKSGVPKYLQLVIAIENAVKSKQLEVGGILPSVNEICSKCGLSRDTVFKAYSELKSRNVIESVPNKGYYVSSNTPNVFLFLDTLKAYKEVLYGAFRAALPESINVDVHFHHYNAKVFESIVRAAAGKYRYYIIMNFDDNRVKSALKYIDPAKLLCIDWKINVPKKSSFIGQEFGLSVYNELAGIQDLLNKYSKLVFIYPEYTNHPKESVNNFLKYCSNFKIRHEVVYKIDLIKLEKNVLFFTVSDRAMARLLDLSEEKNFILGQDFGIISYNDTPTKKYIKNGITVISTDFKEMGRKMADFIMYNSKFDEFIPTKIIKRASL